MPVIKGHRNLQRDQRGAVIALGNFDGVHLGHQVVLGDAAGLAQRLGAPLGVVLFAPHPRRFFAPDAPHFRLMSADRRNRTLEGFGATQLHELAFNADMARMNPEEFVETVLHAGLGVRGIVTGSDFRFGVGRAGAASDLSRLAQERGIEVMFADLRGNGADKISSTRIRKAIHDGDMAAARQLLGRDWAIDGLVSAGDQRGRTIGFPTANIELGDFVRPAYGVYAVRVGINGSDVTRPGVANLGKRPTVDGSTELLEVHLFDFDNDLYDCELAVEFHDFIRAEQKFDGLDTLKSQIAKDAVEARRVLKAVAGPA
jgi:riboflavin kinase/FMN adenylyltransferase